MRHLPLVLAAFWLLASCGDSRNSAAVSVESAPAETPPAAPRPSAVLRAGEYPLWFQLTEAGPVLLESIEDACFSAALIPWPLAPHIRFVIIRKNELLLAVNREGFIRLSPWDGGGLGLYHYPGGEFWRQYTLGAFVLLGENPAALLYRDDRFLDTGASLPRPRFWTPGAEANEPLPLAVPALDAFPPEEGWDVDTLRPGPDGYWYYRLVKKGRERPELLMFRGADLDRPGEPVSLAAFQNSAAPEPLGAAPAPLREALEFIFGPGGGAPGGTAGALSPDFPQGRYFGSGDDRALRASAFWQNGEAQYLALAVLPGGAGLRITKSQSSPAPEPSPFSLPPLPEGFVYTCIALAGDSLFAAWEEQAEYSTGAAGFMVIKPDWLR